MGRIGDTSSKPTNPPPTRTCVVGGFFYKAARRCAPPQLTQPACGDGYLPLAVITCMTVSKQIISFAEMGTSIGPVPS